MLRRLIALGLLTLAVPAEVVSQESPTEAEVFLKRCYIDELRNGHYEEAVRVCEQGLAVAEGRVAAQLHFFAAYALYQQGRDMAESPGDMPCESARYALTKFEEATLHLDQASEAQNDTEEQVRESIRVYSERQEAILQGCGPSSTTDSSDQEAF